MTRKKNTTGEKLLTEVELEMMRILWQLGNGTVKDVLEALPEERDLAYTSVATILKILEKKKFLESRRTERAHEYFPSVSKSDYESKSLSHLVKEVFSGEPSSLVMKLLNESDLSKDELNSIRTFLNQRLS